MKRVKYERYIHGEKCTIGRFAIDGVVLWYGLEPPKYGHPHRIPVGIYKCRRFMSPHNGACYLLLNVPGFSMVEIHIGNYPSDTIACILPGKKVAKTQNAVESSGAALNEMFKKLGKEFELEVINI